MRRLVNRFRATAFDMVPFVLANGPGHAGGDDPERVRGTVRDLELSGDGLFARIEASERGARLIEENPELPVSVRLVADRAGGEALAHVLATLDPVARGMGPWRPVELAGASDVIDLSNGSYSERRGYLVLDGETGEPVGRTNGAGGMVELANVSTSADDEAEGLLADLLELSEDREREARELVRRWKQQEGRI